MLDVSPKYRRTATQKTMSSVDWRRRHTDHFYGLPIAFRRVMGPDWINQLAVLIPVMKRKSSNSCGS